MLETKKNTRIPVVDVQSGGLTLSDIYFVIFRRKWLILFFFLVGLIVAGVLYVNQKPVYRSDSKLLVRYIVESKSPVPLGDESQVKSPDVSGSTIINSEIEILTSLDLYTRVAELVGPANILKSAGGGDDKFLAGIVIARGMSVDVPPHSNIIKVTFRHRDPEIIKPVLDRLIEEYQKRHVEIHQGPGTLDTVLSQQSDQLRSRLNETEEELRKLKSKAGVISLEETKRAYIEEMSNLRRELFNTEAALAESRAALGLGPTNTVASSNTVSVTKDDLADIPNDIVNRYKETSSRLAEARNREFSLQGQYSDEHVLLRRAREQVAEVDQQRKDLEQQYPGLKLQSSPQPGATTPELAMSGLERHRAVALQAKVNALKKQLEEVRLEAAKLDEIETSLKQLQRKRDLEETNFRYFSAGLERSRFDETLGSLKNANINLIQTPTPPRPDESKRLKMAGGALGGGLAAGLLLAFLLELFLDQTVRRAPELTERLHIPLFLSVPYVNGKARRIMSRRNKKRARHGGGTGEEASPEPATAWEMNHPLRPSLEGLRERMALHFKNVTHKPKLIGISTCSAHAGATTIAAGLAAALSETGDGKVLLVDMHQPQGTAHPFFQGKHACELGDVLQEEKRETGMVQENLYMALAQDSTNPRLGMVTKQFSSWVPRLKASDYDYIIFDMPRVSAISPTVRLASMMDLNLLVVEAGKVPRQGVKQAYWLLANTGANTEVILNKVRTYVPARLSGEL
jgi:uncharacterized protein involved in exopolysaccharide biosynthesis/Mrp family chromosome partitioning ATPase